ncbi:hypothetical protein [Pseudosporangium ferrugineum]|uniref:Uncharacterized protein n=1 Tax=Pseudosporangium ferrugineum TaxID=439699 RepID=A0A2T0SHM1_9ACTN|nr:hypothetical protein [Pseudosporangium ferrugineum]PRY32906.1 hypothetical protein CLV70_10165 [Pseudosporangium ferrugineum]
MTEQSGKTPTVSSPSSRWAWLLLMVLTAGVVSGVAGLLSRAGGSNVPGAVLTGGAAFAGTVGLLLGVAHWAKE